MVNKIIYGFNALLYLYKILMFTLILKNLVKGM
ncbi:hypothetical protein SAMN05444008_105172 [Cnuella takakiae]|uniref:Uncharacterized protein n=1 Tax=Cnuella takakiae TaxID=1302690 RepID=A0A1M4ZD50_9BACT|nr:hypothetical protein SAMN05444008_105172 [Cnuella takakiae]